MWPELCWEIRWFEGWADPAQRALTHTRDRLPKRADLTRFFTEPRCRTESCPQSYFLHKGGKPFVVAPNLVWTSKYLLMPREIVVQVLHGCLDVR